MNRMLLTAAVVGLGLAFGGGRAFADGPALDTDGDGYTDYEETTNPLFTNPQADYHTPGVLRADPRKPDIFIEVDYMGKKTKRVPYFWTPWSGWLYTTVTVEGAHNLDASDANAMIARFKERGWNVHIVVDEEIPHDHDVTNYAKWDELAARYRDFAPYYHTLIVHKAASEMAGSFGVAKRDRTIIFDGEIAVDWFQGQDVMHELGHCLIDGARTNPKAQHLLDKPAVWNDGIHCPYNCVMNYASKLGVGGLISQWWEFNYDSKCWGAVRGRYQY